MYRECKECQACHLRNDQATQVVPWEAGTSTQVMFISEAPGKVEDEVGIPFQGPAGQIFDNIVAALGFERGRETHVTNVVKCRPPRNRTPTKKECNVCANLFLDREMEIVQPKAIICFGKTAAEYILEVSGNSLGKLRGTVYNQNGISVGVSYHPAYLLYNKHNEAAIKWSMWDDITGVLAAAGVEYHKKKRGEN